LAALRSFFRYVGACEGPEMIAHTQRIMAIPPKRFARPRLTEITGLRDQDLTLGVGAHIRCEGKGRKERCTPMTNRQIKDIVPKAWAATRNTAPRAA
jgi:integrase/recombinase XerD